MCRHWLMAIFVCAMGAAGSAHGELPLARLSAVFPPAGRVGTTVEVSLSGQDLDEVKELYFSGGGITAKLKLTEKGEAEAGNSVQTVGTIPRARNHATDDEQCDEGGSDTQG